MCGKDVPTMLEQMLILCNDLRIVEKDIVPAFPDHYNIFDFFLQNYHSQFVLTFQNFSNDADDLSTKDVLDLIQWVINSYDAQMGKVNAQALEPPLMNVIEPLMDSYKKHIKTSMIGFMERIIIADQEQEPEVIKGLYFTDGPENLFKTVTQQLEIVNGTEHQEFLMQVVDTCYDVLAYYLDTFLSLLYGSWASLRFQYLLACINNAGKSMELLQQFTGQIDLPDSFSPKISTRSDQILEKFQEQARAATELTVSFIIKDVDDLISGIFTKTWVDAPKEEDFVDTVLATVEDYFENDIRGFVSDANLRSISVEMLSRLIASYVQSILNSKLKFKQPVVARLQQDTKLLTEFFDSYMREKVLENKMLPLKLLTEAITSSPADLPAVRQKLCQQSEFTASDVDNLLSRRKDLEKSSIRVRLTT